MRNTRSIFFPTYLLISIFSFIANEKIETYITYNENCYQINQTKLNVDTTEVPDKEVFQNNRRSKNKCANISDFKPEVFNFYNDIDYISIKESSLFAQISILIQPTQKINLHLLQLF